MEFFQTWWICFSIFVLLGIPLNQSEAQIYDVTACHGTQNADCDYFSMSCDPETRIRVHSMLYGVKDYKCSSSNSRCLKSNRNGCCAFKENDCVDSYTQLHAYNLYRDCSHREKCGPLPVPNQIMARCDKKASTYVALQYECVPYTTDVTIDFCEDRVIFPEELKANIVFKAETSTFRGSSCSCRITNLLSNITTSLVDIRMVKTGNKCSSARLIINQNGGQEVVCDSTASDKDNFVYQSNFESSDALRIALTDLNKNGKSDVPTLVWIIIEGALRIECSNSDSPVVTSPLPSSAGSTSQTTDETQGITGEQNDSDGSSVGIIAGSVAGVVVVIIVVAIVAFILLKRRKKGPKRMMARENSYTATSSVKSASNSIYDEINDTELNNGYESSKKHEALYDPVYESKHNNGATGSTANSIDKCHTYQNVGKSAAAQDATHAGSENNQRYVFPKRLKVPFSKVKKQTNRFVDFLKARTGQEPVVAKQRPREASGGSYDHLQVGPVTVEVSPPSDEPRNAYSHTAPVQRATNNQQNNAKNQKTKALQAKDIKVIGLETSTQDVYSREFKNKNTTIKPPKSKIGLQTNQTEIIQKCPSGSDLQAVHVGDKSPSESDLQAVHVGDESPSGSDLQAVHVGDEYIEFQFDVDEDNPNLVQPKQPDTPPNNLRPVPPSRDPPSPSTPRSSPALNVSAPVSSRAPSPLPKPQRPPSPVLTNLSTSLTPTQQVSAKVDTDGIYDYADPNRLCASASGAIPHGRKSPNHRPKDEVDQDEQTPYDYADVSDDDEGEVKRDTIDSVYEDVGNKQREASVKKHLSEADMYSLRGYEVPVATNSRPISSPYTSTTNIPDYQNLEKNTQKPLRPPATPKLKQNVQLKKEDTPTVVTAQPKVGISIDLKSELQQKLQKTRDKQQITPSKTSPTVKDTKHEQPNSANSGVVKSDNTATKDYEKPPDKKSVLNMAKVFEIKKT